MCGDSIIVGRSTRSMLVELLLPRRGLLVQLAVVDAADVLLLLLDVLLLRLARLQLLLVALAALSRQYCWKLPG